MLISLYKKKTVSVSPLWEGHDKPIWDIFVQPILSQVTVEKDGSRKKSHSMILQFKDIFYQDETLISRVFVQGEPGIGKTTFLTKLALDWCDEKSLNSPGHNATFSDIETLSKFQFLFYISLRDAQNQRKVIDMIKTQIIDKIYIGEKRKEANKLVKKILERETCIVTMDGLNEWVDDNNVLPQMANCLTQCVSLITTRPWKMAEGRIKDSEIGNLLEIQGITDSEKLTKNMIHSLQTGSKKTHTEFMNYVRERRLTKFLTSPWLQTVLISLWMNDKALPGSICELNCILLDLLFKKANAEEGCFKEGSSIACLSNTRYIAKQVELFDKLAEAAFNFTFSSQKSLVIAKCNLLRYMSEEDIKFFLRAGVLTEKYGYTIAEHQSHFSFIHETIQEFLAAYYIAFSKKYNMERRYNVLEMSQTLIYLYGLDCQTANKLINHLVEGDILNDINRGLSSYMLEFYNAKQLLDFQADDYTKDDLKSKQDQMDYHTRCLSLSVLFQRMLIAGFIEAEASGQKGIVVECRDFVFDKYLDKSDSNVLKKLLMLNVSDVRSLISGNDELQNSEIMKVIRESKYKIKRIKAKLTPGMLTQLHNLNIQELSCIGKIDVLSLSAVLHTLSHLTSLYIEESTFNEDVVFPDTLQYLHFRNISCRSVFLQKLIQHLSSFDHNVRLDLCDLKVTDFTTRENESELISSDMSKIDLFVHRGGEEFYELLRCLGVVKLGLCTADDVSSVSTIIPSLKKLEHIHIWGVYTGLCNLKLPDSLKCISLQEVECSCQWLISLLITLSSVDHPVDCELWDIVLKTSKQAAEKNSTNKDLVDQFKLSSKDLSILVNNCCIGMFEIFRETKIRTLSLRTAESLSKASEIIATLTKLKKLYIRGTYIGLCELVLPNTLTFISLVKCDCSSEWLYSMFTILASKGNRVSCELLDVVSQSSKGALDKKLASQKPDMKNIKISVKNVSMEVFQILREINIGILSIRTAHCASKVSDILSTLKHLKKLSLHGTYNGSCDLMLPDSLECLKLEKVTCSYEWLFSVLIMLSSLGHDDHDVELKLVDVKLQSSDRACGDTSIKNVSYLGSNPSPCDMSFLKVFVINGSVELFEIFRGTSIRNLKLGTGGCVSNAWHILPTLEKLERLYLRGAYKDRFDMELPNGLQYISMSNCECSCEWLCCLFTALDLLHHPVEFKLLNVKLQTSLPYTLNPLVELNLVGSFSLSDRKMSLQVDTCTCYSLCSLLITLFSFDPPVKCELCNVVLQTSDEASGTSLERQNIEMFVENGSVKLFEIFRHTRKMILHLRTSVNVGTMGILPTLSKLEKLYLRGTYVDRCTFQMPASFQCLRLHEDKSLFVWLYFLFALLSVLDNPVECEFSDFKWNSVTETITTGSNIRLSHWRSEQHACHMSNIEICFNNDNIEMFEIFRHTNIEFIILGMADCVSNASDILPSLLKLEKLYLWDSFMGSFSFQLPVSLRCISLLNVDCSFEWLCSLMNNDFSLHQIINCELWDVVLHSSEVALGADSAGLEHKILLRDKPNIKLLLNNGGVQLLEIFRYTGIEIHNNQTADCILQALSRMPTSRKLKKLCFGGTYMGRFDFRLPAALQSICLSTVECSSVWLCCLLTTLSSEAHIVHCDLWDVVLKSNEGTNYMSLDIDVSYSQPKLSECDISNIEICVKHGSMELFEIFLDTNIKILELSTADCTSRASNILGTLRKLENLYLRGNYLGHCDFYLPDSLKCILLSEVHCSVTWLRSILIKISSINRPVKCELLDVVLHPSEETSNVVSDVCQSYFRHHMCSPDMSNIELFVNNSSVELFELFRDTSIGVLDLATADCVSHALAILPSLRQLGRLCLKGRYMCYCDLKLPDSIKCICLSEADCSATWLNSLLITLSSVNKPVKCELWDVVLQSSEDICSACSAIHASNLRSEMLTYDLSNIEIFLTTGSLELFEIFHNTNIGTLGIRTDDYESEASNLIYTLNKLENLTLWGKTIGVDLQLPSSLKCVSLHVDQCSCDWLCRFLITLFSFDHPVKCELFNVLLQTSEEASGPLFEKQNIEIFVDDVSIELFEILLNTRERMLNLRKSAYVGRLGNLPTLRTLDKLYLRGIYMGRCNFKLDALSQWLSLKEDKKSFTWLCFLFNFLSLFGHPVECELSDCTWNSMTETNEIRSYIRVFHSQEPACHFSNIEVCLENGSIDMFEILCHTNIDVLDLGMANCFLQASHILPSLLKLENLYLWDRFRDCFSFQLPISLRSISLLNVDCSFEWLCSLLKTVFSLKKTIKCEFWNVVLHSSAAVRDADSDLIVCGFHNQIILRERPDINLYFDNCGVQLLEIFRYKDKQIHNDHMTDCILQELCRMPNFRKLERINLVGIYMDRFNIWLPTSLQRIFLSNVHCSAAWLCSLLSKLTSEAHVRSCDMWDVVLQSNERTDNLCSCDMSNIEICVKNGSMKLFNIFRNSKIEILYLITADSFSNANIILHTLKKLKKLYLRGNYLGRCDFCPPNSLQSIVLSEVRCSTTWLKRLLITLSKEKHYTECELWDVRLQPNNKILIEPDYKMPSFDLSNIGISVIHVNSNVFEIFRQTNIRILQLGMACSVSQASDILPTLSNLEKLYLWGTFSGPCVCQLPVTLKCISLLNVVCSPEWLCSLLITFFSLNQPEQCELCVNLSDILYTLDELTTLYLCGVFTNRFFLKLPCSLQCISLRESECSSEWLCSLLLALSDFKRHVTCELWDVELKSSAETPIDGSHTNLSYLLTAISSLDMANINIFVKNTSATLFEILRDTRIGSLGICASDSCELPSVTQKQLTMLNENV